MKQTQTEAGDSNFSEEILSKIKRVLLKCKKYKEGN